MIKPVYASAYNTRAVAKGYEMGGYIKYWQCTHCRTRYDNPVKQCGCERET